jgi:hypothetical protein
MWNLPTPPPSIVGGLLIGSGAMPQPEIEMRYIRDGRGGDDADRTGSGVALRDAEMTPSMAKSPSRVGHPRTGRRRSIRGIRQLPMLGRECRFIAGYQTLRRGVLKVGT